MSVYNVDVFLLHVSLSGFKFYFIAAYSDFDNRAIERMPDIKCSQGNLRRIKHEISIWSTVQKYNRHEIFIIEVILYSKNHHHDPFR